jgi:hypothetical protein
MPGRQGLDAVDAGNHLQRQRRAALTYEVDIRKVLS